MAIFKKRGIYWIGYYAYGRRRREPIGSSYKLAAEVLHKRKAEIAEGKHFLNRRGNMTTFRELAEKYKKQYAKHKKSAAEMIMRIDNLVKMLGDKKLNAITPFMVQEMRNKIKETRTIATANRYHAILKSIFNRAREWRLFYGENPATVIKIERETPNRLRYLSREEITRLLEACSPRLFPVVAFALLTGMRRGEILALKWEDVDLEQRIVYLTETKSGRPREIPIMDKLYDLLVPMRQVSGPVFKIPTITLRRHYDKALKLSGIVNFHFHDLRHTFASHFVMITHDLYTLQKILGHSTPLLTQRYAHLSNRHLRSNMAKLDSEWAPIWASRQDEPLIPFTQNASVTNVEMSRMERLHGPS
ncbi:MAG TPA: hypothetical protein DCL44_06210 [Elusimicrobia bacterium]|nr:hypothetical protein [Elusimicrobiota bacterium]